jgi:hypothetical protein
VSRDVKLRIFLARDYVGSPERIRALVDYRILLVKAVCRSASGEEVEAVLYKELVIPFVPYAGLRISVGLSPSTVRAEDLVWIAQGQYFRFDAEPWCLDESIARGGATSIDQMINFEAIDGWKVWEEEASEKYP